MAALSLVFIHLKLGSGIALSWFWVLFPAGMVFVPIFLFMVLAFMIGQNSKEDSEWTGLE